MTDIKICGLFRERDIDFVNEARPEYAGFVLNFPKSHRSLDIERAMRLKKLLLPDIKAVGVFVDEDAEIVCLAAEYIGLSVIQLHGKESPEDIDYIRDKAELPVWKAFRIKGESDLLLAEKSNADEILLDSGKGSGITFDWSILKGSSRPFILAGGLTADNIPEAVRLLGPKIIDISSGVETEGVKDRNKILTAVRIAHSY